MTDFIADLIVKDQTRLPIVALVVKSWQYFDGKQQNMGVNKYHIESQTKDQKAEEKAWRKDVLDVTNLKGIYHGRELIHEQVQFEKGEKIYWTIAWQNMHDPAIYYLVRKVDVLWQFIEKTALHELNKFIGDTIDVCTESDAGTVLAVAADHYVDAVYAQSNRNADQMAKIENKINTDRDKQHLTITLNCDRQTGYIYSPNHDTNCNVRFYLKDNPDGKPPCG
jgi:hypothetical protein